METGPDGLKLLDLHLPLARSLFGRQFILRTIKS
jgi:hypothetical protein